MAGTEALIGQLKATFRDRERTSGEEAPLGELPFITISRQAGAGGSDLARAILAELVVAEGDPRLRGWSSYGEELCRIIASDPELNVSLRELLAEEYRTRAEDYVAVMLGKSFQDEIQQKIAVTIRRLALIGKVILIGRGGVCITRDLAPGIHVRLVAPREVRIERMMGILSLGESEAARWVDDHDRSRAKLVKSRFKRNIDDAQLYDATWNTDSVDREVIARCIVQMVRDG